MLVLFPVPCSPFPLLAAMSETSFYATQIQATQSGDPWYGPPITQVVEGLTSQQASARPTSQRALDLGDHPPTLTSWVREVKRRLEQGNPHEPDDGDWPPVPDPTEGNWWQALDELETAHAELREQLFRHRRKSWRTWWGRCGIRRRGPGVSYAAMMQGLLQHDAYHLGQVALLKKAIEKR